MNRRSGQYVLIAVAVIAAGAAMVRWLMIKPAVELELQVPGLDGAPTVSTQTAGTDTVVIGAHFDVFDTVESSLTGKWPRFRGAGFDNIARDPRLNLVRTLLIKQPEEQWRVELGEGHGAPAVYDGFVYVLDYDEATRADALRCFALGTGKEVWRRWYPVPMKRNHGYSRTVPAITDSFIVTLGPQCHVMCVERRTGRLRWGRDLPRRYGTDVPMWFTGQCPLVDGDVAVLAPGGDALLVGIRCGDGVEAWRTPNPDGWRMSHASVVPMAFSGQRMYVYSSLDGVAGIAADGPDRGSVLWKNTEWKHAVIAPSPVQVEGNRIFVAAGYGVGSGIITVAYDNGVFGANLTQAVKPADGMSSEQQTPVYHNGYLYGVLSKDAGPMRNRFVCVHPDDLTKYVWDSGKTRRFGLGPYLLLNGHFLVLSDAGELTVAEAVPDGYREKAHYGIIDGKDTWGPMAYADGRLLVRDDKTMVCLGVR